MISFKRPITQPATLTSARATKAEASLAALVATGHKPKTADFERLWGERDVRNALWELQRKKCCYCERPRDATRESDIEHFRPKAGITGEPAHFGYWWLSYSWHNLFFACTYCNQEYKKNHFPLLESGVRARGKVDSLSDEQPYLVDPSQEDPEQFIAFDWQKDYGISVFPYGVDNDGRGDKTIDITGLDRMDLNTDRASTLSDLEALERKMKHAKYVGCHLLITESAAEIKYATSCERRYTGFRRAFFRAMGLGEYIAKD